MTAMPSFRKHNPKVCSRLSRHEKTGKSGEHMTSIYIGSATLARTPFSPSKQWRGIATRYAKNLVFPCGSADTVPGSLAQYLVTTLSRHF
jgi:hypothetical protein